MRTKQPERLEKETKSAVDWAAEDAYWRQQHGNQLYADKSRSYQDYPAVYCLGAKGAEKNSGRDYDEVEQSLATDYERAEPGSGLPWGHGSSGSESGVGGSN